MPNQPNKPKQIIEKLQNKKGFRVCKKPLSEKAKSEDQLERIEAKLDLLLQEKGIKL